MVAKMGELTRNSPYGTSAPYCIGNFQYSYYQYTGFEPIALKFRQVSP